MKKSGQTKEITDYILNEIAKGRSLRSVCLDDDTPAPSTFLLWVSKDDELAEQYARAAEARADYVFDEMLDIADDATNDWMEREYEDGRIIELPDKEVIARSKLRIETRKWMLGKMKPKVYGDAVRLKHGGDPDSPPIQSEVSPSDKLKDMVSAIAKRSATTSEPE